MADIGPVVPAQAKPAIVTLPAGIDMGNVDSIGESSRHRTAAAGEERHVLRGRSGQITRR